ncbi:signal peptidase complex-like protein DTM1 [Prunus yedoensis var. nudiflora]|uniref:Signal peptidase complex-like protein DTM1 n=1 Tax=Prunus yedoensis var. nudiflora TaxID=2094558 RepID=A0A314XRD7_PRUYE|nr:signal peptidase complex-like protein DTM1 [Prunus yedoensis var. nudiflora]
MANDAVFRASLVWLAAVIAVVGVCTQSFKKMMLTYVVGVLGISGLLLPDWGYFDRDFSRWTSPVSAEERASEVAQRSGLIRRFRKNPMRLVAYATVYGFALYKWWMFISS